MKTNPNTVLVMVVKGSVIELEANEAIILNMRGRYPVSIPVTPEILRTALAMYVAASK